MFRKLARNLSNSRKLQIASDLHLEFHKDPKLTDFIQPSAPYLALAGDIGIPYMESYKSFLSQCSKAFKKTFVVTGNHEYYQFKNKVPYEKFWSIRKTNEEIRNMTQKFGNVVFLDRDAHTIDGNNVILGTTLWSGIIGEHIGNAYLRMNDFNQIYVDETSPHILNPTHKRLSVHAVNDMFRRNVSWLEENIKRYKSQNITIITHHMPSYKLVAPRFVNNPINCCFASNLDGMMGRNVKYWISGHTHTNMDLYIGGTRCVINPRGYKNEHHGFKRDLVIDL